MAADYTVKRGNWINAGIAILFGAAPGQIAPKSVGLHGAITQFQNWLEEGVSVGFLQRPGSGIAPLFPPQDSDFVSSLDNITADDFVSTVSSLRDLIGDSYAAIQDAIATLKP